MVSSAGAKVASDKMKHPFMTKSQPFSKEHSQLKHTARGAHRTGSPTSKAQSRSSGGIPLPHPRSYNNSGQPEGKRKGKHIGKEGVKHGILERH